MKHCTGEQPNLPQFFLSYLAIIPLTLSSQASSKIWEILQLSYSKQKILLFRSQVHYLKLINQKRIQRAT